VPKLQTGHLQFNWRSFRCRSKQKDDYISTTELDIHSSAHCVFSYMIMWTLCGYTDQKKRSWLGTYHITNSYANNAIHLDNKRHGQREG